jgi:16S rRNA U516 pseudouridylate synthase RsuA-like enzyme
MFAKRGRLDRLLSAHFQVPRRDIRTWLVGARIQVDGVVVKDLTFRSTSSVLWLAMALCFKRTTASTGCYISQSAW